MDGSETFLQAAAAFLDFGNDSDVDADQIGHIQSQTLHQSSKKPRSIGCVLIKKQQPRTVKRSGHVTKKRNQGRRNSKAKEARMKRQNVLSVALNREQIESDMTRLRSRSDEKIQPMSTKPIQRAPPNKV